MRTSLLILFSFLFVLGVESQIAGKSARRDGILVADLTPFQGDEATMLRQQQCQNSCSGHGVCVIQEGSLFPPVCNCFHLWSGPDCSIAECPNNCSSAGVCNHSNGYCICEPGMGKADCSVNLRLDLCPNDCSGNGICSHGKCSCYQSWEGPDCKFSKCPNNCTFHGVCADLDPSFGGAACVCNAGYSGADCGIKVEQCPGKHQPCSGNGVCDDKTGKCTCTRGFSGVDCAHKDCVSGYLSRTGRFAPPWTSEGCPNDCSCHGYCLCNSEDDHESCYCACEPTWGGDACDFAIPSHVPFDGVSQPYPDKLVYPHLHPYLSDDERAAIALKREALRIQAEEPELLVQQQQ